MAKLAFLGLGAMGSRMAARLLGAGHQVTVWNRSPEAAHQLSHLGALIAASPRAAVAGAAAVFSMVRDDEASRAIWLDPNQGALAAMTPGALAAECSTLTVGYVKQLAAKAQAAGLAFLDAPVAGSRPQAEAGELIFLVGGGGTALETARPFLATMGKTVHHLGDSGSGAAVKLAVNALFAVQIASMAELIGLLAALKLDVKQAVEIIGQTPVASLAAKGAGASMLARQFAPLFPVELVSKDLDYIAALANTAGSDTPIAAAARGVMSKAIARGFGADHLTGVVRLYC